MGRQVRPKDSKCISEDTLCSVVVDSDIDERLVVLKNMNFNSSKKHMSALLTAVGPKIRCFSDARTALAPSAAAAMAWLERARVGSWRGRKARTAGETPTARRSGGRTVLDNRTGNGSKVSNRELLLCETPAPVDI